MKRIAILAISLAASTTVLAQQGGQGPNTPQGPAASKAAVKSKAGTTATVQGGGQTGGGQGQHKATMKSKAGTTATVQGPGQGPQGGQMKAKGAMKDRSAMKAGAAAKSVK
jgi:hypothetical protein